jgi:hypothetical protein
LKAFTVEMILTAIGSGVPLDRDYAPAPRLLADILSAEFYKKNKV